MESLNLPEDLEELRNKIDESVKPFLRIQLSAAEESDRLKSRVGGAPVLPEETPLPVNEKGQPLVFLAQINFSEMPTLPYFPEKGLLQFYVNDDRMYGLNFDNPARQENFRVMYFSAKELEALQPVTDYPEKFTHSPVITRSECTFDPMEAPVSVSDIHFDQVFGKASYQFFKSYESSVESSYTQLALGGGNKIGGYAHFTQEDPRWVQTDFEKAILLLQLDSDGEYLQWGDRGIAHFFILPEDLENKDFSRVLFNWDSP